MKNEETIFFRFFSKNKIYKGGFRGREIQFKMIRRPIYGRLDFKKLKTSSFTNDEIDFENCECLVKKN